MALTNDQITAKNFKEFYDRIYPYLNGGLARNNYSTDEQVVGTWIDGKPLYQKTIDFGALPNATTKTVSSGLTNVTIFDIKAVAYGSSSTSMLPYVDGGSAATANMGIYYDRSNNNISVKTGSDRSSIANCYVTIQYTKTTD